MEWMFIWYFFSLRSSIMFRVVEHLCYSYPRLLSPALAVDLCSFLKFTTGLFSQWWPSVGKVPIMPFFPFLIVDHPDHYFIPTSFNSFVISIFVSICSLTKSKPFQHLFCDTLIEHMWFPIKQLCDFRRQYVKTKSIKGFHIKREKRNYAIKPLYFQSSINLEMFLCFSTSE